jgi:hypothetical protein
MAPTRTPTHFVCTKAILSLYNCCNNQPYVTFASDVTDIPFYALRECSSLVSVIIPSSVISIDSWAFNNCPYLTSLTLGSNLRTIGYVAFASTALTRVTIPLSVTSIGDNAFPPGVILNQLTHQPSLSYKPSTRMPSRPTQRPSSSPS